MISKNKRSQELHTKIARVERTVQEMDEWLEFNLYYER